MNKTQVYREAAKLIYNGNQYYSCIAVRKATRKEESCYVNSEALFYERVFHEATDPRSFLIQIETSQDAQELRVMLLCMMAACWKDFFIAEACEDL